MSTVDIDLEKTIEELKKAVPFKDSTEIGDVVLMIRETEDPEAPISAAYAVINDIVRDPSKRDEWWFVHFTFLYVPPQPQMIILQENHFTGQEIFTMGGLKVFIQALDFAALHSKADDEDSTDPEPENNGDKKKGGLRVVK